MRHQYLAGMGIQAWRLRRSSESEVAADAVDAGADADTPIDSAVAVSVPVSAHAVPAVPDWERLQADVASCTRCELHTQRTQTVFGVGNRSADWMVIGEAPGAEEDRQGEPFVGRAGKLLDAMLRATGRSRDQVFIANILKCRPPNNRDPHNEEVAQCRDYLQAQIDLLQPRVILAVGRIAAQSLLQTESNLGRLRGKVHAYSSSAGEIPVVVTYHPAYLLRSPAEKRKAWEDLRLAMQTLAGACS